MYLFQLPTNDISSFLPFTYFVTELRLSSMIEIKQSFITHTLLFIYAKILLEWNALFPILIIFLAVVS